MTLDCFTDFEKKNGFFTVFFLNVGDQKKSCFCMVVILLPYVFRPQILLSYVLHIVGTVNFALLFFSKILPKTD